MNINFNEAKNGIEIRFDEKPDSKILDSLKERGFRWSVKQKMWYGKNTQENSEFVNSLNDGEIKPIEREIYDLWTLTRTEDIKDNHDYIHNGNGYCEAVKEIAAIIRKHVRERFPMCKISVRLLHHDNIDISIKESPFAKDSEELKAIIHYIYKFANSYNYDNSDIMSDYFDVGFYGVYESGMVDSCYMQTEETVNIKNISELFAQKKADFEKSEAEREEKEFQEYLIKREIEKAEEARLEAIRKAEHEEIVSGANIVNVEYFIMNLDNPGRSKACKIDEYFDSDLEHYRCNAKITKELRLNEKVYDLFKNHLLDNFDFFTPELGGVATDDLRIQSWTDYSKMSAEERESVETYENNCVAVYCNDELKFIIDTEGYSYARYCFLIDSKTYIKKEYKTASGISEKEFNENTNCAEELEKICDEITEENGFEFPPLNAESQEKFKSILKDRIYKDTLSFNLGIVRATKNEWYKTLMYGLLAEVEGIQDQFDRAGFEPEQKITIIRIGDFGGLNVTHGKFKSYEKGSYAQYDKSVKLVFRPENKRMDYYKWFYGDILIFNDWLNVPDDVLWETFTSNTGLVCKKTRFLSCDKKMYDAVLDYFKQRNIKPIINTYKPQF